MHALTHKLWRDLWQLKGQAVAIAAVIMAGVATFIMFLSTLDSLQYTRNYFYKEYRFAEVFSSLTRAPQSLAARIGEIPGVDKVETRVVSFANLDVPGFIEPVIGRLVSIPENREPLLNRLYLRQGRLVEPHRADEVVLSEAFAEAHGLQPGDKLHAVINGTRRQLTIVGTALSPEYIHQLRPGGVFPDFKRYAVLWMGREALGSAYDLEGAFNDVVLGLSRDARAKDVIEHLDELLERYGGGGAYAREHQLSHHFLNEEFKQLGHLATIFPVLFLGVAAFLLNVVISRLVTMQREQIATLKAFGYRNRDVVLHYLELVMVIVISGVATGVVLGIWLGRGMSDVYMAFFRFPFLLFHLRPEMVLNAAAVSSAAATLGTLFAVRKAAALRPAQAMRPEPPARYRETLLEQLGLKRFLSQPTRMIFRHIQRRPIKSMLTVFGIALACGVTMTGRFQNDTVGYMLDVQYGQSRREDLAVGFFEPTSKKAKFALQSLPGVERVEVFRGVPVRLRFEHREHRTGITAVEPGGEIMRLLDADLKPIRLPAQGILLTDYLGGMLGVKAGDDILVEVLEGARPVRQVRVVGLVKEYMGVSGYMSLDALNHLMREGPAISGALLAIDEQYLPTLFERFKQMPRIAGVFERVQEIRNFHRVMDETMLFVTYVATVFAVVIAFGVVYNSARIALTERSRELASLRVLGFTRAEISYILLGELALLTLVAIPLGLYLGYELCVWIAYSLQSELYRVPVVINTNTYAFAATVVIVSAVVSALLVRRKLDQLDLIAVLKTKE
jgi:putative ABC transport system permease protein